MGSIRKLPDNLVNQIAAGEVVERPSSVVKELVENALDAGSGSVEVVLQGGGRRRVRVADDGCGMSPEDARLALERHATSKIRTEEDLDAIGTLGFRGEALPAIASVSRLSLLTSTGEGAGSRVEVEAGTVVREAPEARPRGTTVDVQDLFFNTPARAKFLRTVATELARSTETVYACALARPGVRFRLEHEGRELLQVAPASDTRDRVRQIFGAELAEGLIPVEAGRSPLSVSGYVSRPAFSRSSRAAQFVFVNGRQVSDRTLSHAIGQACRPHFPRERHPALFLFLEIPPDQVDVNVHPAKREVRFRTPGAIHDLIRRSLEGALSGGRAVQALPALGGAGREAVSDAVENYLADHPQGEEFRPQRFQPAGLPQGPASEPPFYREADLPQPGIAVRILGQLRDTYVVVEDEEGLLLVDQHAAHERILYDRYRQELQEHKVPVQSLLFPVNVEVPPAQAARFEKLVDRLAELGFAVEVFGSNAFLVREVPAIAAGSDPGRLLEDLVEQIAGGEAEEALSDLEHRVAALAACHAAVRAGMRLEPQRALHIVETLFAGGYALTCPHGRPATLRYPMGAIDRAFLRT